MLRRKKLCPREGKTEPFYSCHMNTSAIIVGAGIVGLATARALAIRGYKVTVVERGPSQTGASVRNFGMIWPVGQPAGELFDRAMLSRSIWKQLCVGADIWHSETGSLHLAYHQDELDVIGEYVELDRFDKKAVVISAQRAQELSPAVRPNGLKGALWSETEMIVDARVAVKNIAAYLAEKYKVTFHFNTAVNGVEYPNVFAGKKYWTADEIYVCSGSDFETLYPAVFADTPITKCKLQMMRLAPPPGDFNIGPSLCGGLTLTHYKSFAVAPSLPALKDRYGREHTELLRWGIHVMISQNGDGELTVGDSHEYGPVHDPFNRESINRLILDYLAGFTVIPEMERVESWIGEYPKMTDGRTELIISPEEGVTIINALGGAGMTLSFGLMERYLDSRHSAGKIGLTVT